MPSRPGFLTVRHREAVRAGHGPFAALEMKRMANILFGTFGQENQSQLTLRNSFRGTTNTSKGEFDVEPGISAISGV